MKLLFVLLWAVSWGEEVLVEPARADAPSGQGPPPPVPDLSDEHLRKLFPMIDQDHDGKISLDELRDFHFLTSKTHAVKYFRVPEWMDTDKDNKLSLEELKEANHKAGMSMPNIDPEEIKKQFAKEEAKFHELDVNKEGVLGQEEMILFFHPNLDRRVSLIETKHLMEISDFDHDGFLSKAEFEARQFPADFEKVDVNGDGKLDTEEMHEWSAGLLEFISIMMRVRDIADHDKDQALSLDELLKTRQSISKEGVDHVFRSWAAMHNEL
ncbi:Reticulocalbin-1 [Durusdinium trenchii]|uniref:Reticulocalbin-1 n=1 Tax=Durusdinium trenchii TaxID=1381693 RepID=A0ABP0RPY5_9DINO